MMEKLFKKFDEDGSGALDAGELYDLFQDNGVEIEKDKIKSMFNN